MSLKKNGFIIFLALILISPVAFSQTNISHNGGDSHFGTIAVNQEGVVMVVWCEGAVGNESGTLFYNVMQNGQWQGPRNTSLTWEDGWSPQLDVGPNGNFHLAWADGVSRFTREVFYSMYNVSTGKWSSRAMIYDSPDNSAWERISVDGDKVYVAWFHKNVSPYEGSDIVMIYKTIGGNWNSAYERISWTANNESTHPGLKVKDSRAYISYMEGTPLGTPWKLFVKEAPVGSNWNGISRNTLDENGYYSEIDVDDNDDAHVIFSNRSNNFFYRYQKNGSWQGTQILSNMSAPLQFGDLDYNNNVIVAVWVQNQDIGRSVFYNKKSPGRNWGSVQKLHQGSEAWAPKVWIDNAGYAHFIWDDLNGGANDVFYMKVQAFPPDPLISLNKGSLNFTVEGANPQPTPFEIMNVGEERLTFTVADNKDWISVSPTSGSLNTQQKASIQVTIDALNLDEGNYSGKITVTSPEAINSPQELLINLNVLAPPIYGPVNFTAELKENRALFFREYVHELTWQANTSNRNIEKYRIFADDGMNRLMIAELDATQFSYSVRNVNRNKSYIYELYAVDNKDRTGEPAIFEIDSTSPTVFRSRTGAAVGAVKK